MFRKLRKGQLLHLPNTARFFVFVLCLWTAVVRVGFTSDASFQARSQLQASGLTTSAEDRAGSVKYVVALLPAFTLQSTIKLNFRSIDLSTHTGPGTSQSHGRITASQCARRWLEIRLLLSQISSPLRC